MSKKNVSEFKRKTIKDLVEKRYLGRLMYVAITRAKRYLHLSYSDLRSNYGQQERCQRSQFINEIPLRLVHVNNDKEEKTLYQPPKKKHFSQSSPQIAHRGFISGKNLLNIQQKSSQKKI